MLQLRLTSFLWFTDYLFQSLTLLVDLNIHHFLFWKQRDNLSKGTRLAISKEASLLHSMCRSIWMPVGELPGVGKYHFIPLLQGRHPDLTYLKSLFSSSLSLNWKLFVSSEERYLEITYSQDMREIRKVQEVSTPS